MSAGNQSPTTATRERATEAESAHRVSGTVEDHLRFERFLSQTVASFVGLPLGQIDGALERALRDLTAVLGVDRTAIAQITADPVSLVITHTYAAAGVTPNPVGTDMAPIVPWYCGQVTRGNRLVLDDLPGDLPPEAEAERAYAIAIGMKSHVCLPMKVGDETAGALFVGCFRAHRAFSTEFIGRLELLAGVFGSVLFRTTAHARLAAEQDLSRSVLASVMSEILVLDAKGRIVAVNEAWHRSARRRDLPASRIPLGSDYLAVLAQASAARVKCGAPERIACVRSVLAGETASSQVAYAYAHSSGTRFYLMSVTRLSGAAVGAVVAHTDVTELEQAKENLERALAEVQTLKERLEAENVVLHEEARRILGFDEIVGTSPALALVLREVEQVAQTDAPVLIQGETGTGKDLIARAIHSRSPRGPRPLVTVNCAALPSGLIESELFGYEKGAFTGAAARTLGRFEAAQGGTILLDEIGELPLEVQAKLLRVLQSGELERLGSPKTLKVDARLIAATNRDLEKEVQAGSFRADLFYRLNVFPITVPPLRQRTEDIPLLVWHFIARKQVRMRRSIERVPERLMKKFQAYAWPGNIRELENVIERAIIVSTGPTLETPPTFRDGQAAEPPAPERTRLEDVERAHIQSVLASTGWKLAGKGNAAERLGLNRSTLHFRMKKLGIRRPGSAG
jgi:transcriptional regulator with GAF, ATPase, and Fis domain